MNTAPTTRLFAWDEIAQVHEFLSAAWAMRGARSYMHIGDFYWSLRPSAQFEPTRDVRLWWSGERMAGFAWFDGPGSGEFVVAAGHGELEDEAIAWLESEHRRTAPGVPFSIAAIDDDEQRTSVLASRGYARGEEGAVRFWQPLGADLPNAPAPDAFVVRAVEGDEDIARRVFAQRTSFERSSATVEVWRALMKLPGYTPQLDLVAVAQDGSGAGGCTCWYDEANRAGEFEPVGTSRAYQRMGVGKAIVMEGFRRLRDLGATQAIVQTNVTNAPAIALYRSCGFELVATQHAWLKQMA